MGQPNVNTQPGEKRIKNFREVSLGYTKKLTTEEARRCPQCEDPVCMRGCPLGIDIPGFIRSLREGKISDAYAIIRKSNCLPSVCGRICTAPCEAACILHEDGAPIGIRALERYASDFGRPRIPQRPVLRPASVKVAVVGSGPAGLTAAEALNRRGYQVTIFEAFDKPGGVLRYGVPEFRIPKKTLDQEINVLKMMGITFETNCLIGHTTTMEEIRRDFAAVLLATGAGIPKFMDISGSNLGGVYYGEEFLMRVNRAKGMIDSGAVAKLPLGRKMVVIGSGNTALDCARAGVRLGQEVSLVFRRTEEDMRVSAQERMFAKEEGVNLLPLVKPIEIVAGPNDFVAGLKCVHMDFADPDGSGQWQIMPVPGSDFVLEVDTVVIAVGHHPNSLIHQQVCALKTNDDGTFEAEEETGMTAVPGVFVAGNARTNAGPVVEAMVSGKNAAQEIDRYLK